MQTKELHIFTIVAQNYLAYAFVLADSVVKHHPECEFGIFLLDDVDHRWRQEIEARGFQALYPEDIQLRNYLDFVFKYNITEACTGVKPFVFQALFDRGAKKVLYLDPDILCFRRLDEVLDGLESYAIVLTPHICRPSTDNYFPGETAHLRTGIFNLGFVAVKSGPPGSDFISWWSSRLESQCLQETELGLFVDQKWVDLVPGCFDSVLVLRNLAYNVAYWNLEERALESCDDRLIEVNSGIPLAFIHFSGFSIDDINALFRYSPRSPFDDLLYMKRFSLKMRPDLAGPFALYRDLLVAAGDKRFASIPYSYAAYNNGERISQLERRLFLSLRESLQLKPDPFSAAPDSFWAMCRRAGIRAPMRNRQKASARDVQEKYRLQIKGIQWLLRLCVRLLGPERYWEFCKYMRHQLLSTHQHFLLRRTVPLSGNSDAVKAETQVLREN